jgi:hypothetical protein
MVPRAASGKIYSRRPWHLLPESQIQCKSVIEGGNVMAEDCKNQCPIANLSEAEVKSLTAWEQELSQATGQKIALVAYKVE